MLAFSGGKNLVMQNLQNCDSSKLSKIGILVSWKLRKRVLSIDNFDRNAVKAAFLAKKMSNVSN